VRPYGSMLPMTTTSRKPILAVLVAFVLALVACEQRTPILVYVTPTPLPQIGSVVVSPTPTNTPIPTIGPPPSATPTTETEAQVVRPPATIPPGATIVGPVIGPDYTLPPTSTPRPTETPTEGPSPTGEPPLPTSVEPTPVPPGTPLPGLDPSRMGIQLESNLSQEDWQEAVGRRVDEDLGFHWVKVQVPWNALQPNGPDEYGEPFQRFEQYVQYADREGLNILLSVAKAPPWARSVHIEDGPPDDPQQLANFLRFLLDKLPFVDAIEIWNEPNLRREWQGTLSFNGAGYMRLFGPAYQAIKEVAPDVKVVTAGLAPTGDHADSRDDRAYLREMYNAGLAQYPDIAVGVHPYGWANPPDATCCGSRGWDDDPHFFFNDTLRDYRQMMEAFGHGELELWPTEFGWATWEGFPGEPPEPWMGWIDKWDQGNYILRAFQIGQERPGIGPMFLWNLNFAVLGNLVEARDERAGYSLVVPLNPAERPAYWMLYDAVRPDVQLDRYD